MYVCVHSCIVCGTLSCIISLPSTTRGSSPTNLACSIKLKTLLQQATTKFTYIQQLIWYDIYVVLCMYMNDGKMLYILIDIKISCVYYKSMIDTFPCLFPSVVEILIKAGMISSRPTRTSLLMFSCENLLATYSRPSSTDIFTWFIRMYCGELAMAGIPLIASRSAWPSFCKSWACRLSAN